MPHLVAIEVGGTLLEKLGEGERTSCQEHQQRRASGACGARLGSGFPDNVLQPWESGPGPGPAAEAGASGAASGRGVGEGKCFSTTRVSLPASNPESPYINIDLGSCLTPSSQYYS